MSDEMQETSIEDEQSYKYTRDLYGCILYIPFAIFSAQVVVKVVVVVVAIAVGVVSVAVGLSIPIFYETQIDSALQFGGKAANLYAIWYQLKGSAHDMSKHKSNTWLWDRVRVSDRAYGDFCDFNTHSGCGVEEEALMQAIEHELEVTVRVHEVRCEHERQKEELVLILFFTKSNE